MPTVVGVKLRFVPKTLWFDPGDTEPGVGDSIIVETERGIEIGLVTEAPHEVPRASLPAPLKPVMRVALPEDLATRAEQAQAERTAMSTYRTLVEKHALDMKPIDVEYLFGGDKIVFYFSSEERVDFRELVRELANEFKARIDMRQVGVRDEARLVGGIGHCGQQLCCARLGGEFQPVSIRMAKEQDLPLNPLKISGLCGRLMCCLRYEYDAYKDFKTRAPKRGALLDTPLGTGKVTDLNTPREMVSFRLEDGSSFSVPLGSMGCSKGTGCPCSVSREALEETGRIPVALAAPEREVEAAPAAPARKPRRQGKPDAGAQGGQQPAKAAKGGRDQAPEQPQRRRPRPARDSSGSGNENVEAPAASAGEAGEGAKSSSGRRRRRRRSGGGNGAKDEGAAG